MAHIFKLAAANEKKQFRVHSETKVTQSIYRGKSVREHRAITTRRKNDKNIDIKIIEYHMMMYRTRLVLQLDS